MRAIALHPRFELLEMFGVFHVRDRNLMRAPGALDRQAVDEFWARPTLWRAEDDHRPERPIRRFRAGRARGGLNFIYPCQYRIQRARKNLVHERRIVAFDEKGFVTVTAQQLRQFVATDARQHRRIGDLETVEMKDGKNRTIARGVEEFVGVPTGSQRASFRFAVTDDASDNQIRIVEG